jgi:alginate O-acetyltransferase complex protein AlgI
MVFNSLTFLVFFAAVLFFYYLPLPWAVKKWHLWWSSYLFYAAWNPPFVLLLWVSTLVDWWAGKWLAEAKTPARRKAFLLLSLAVNLGLLSFFKYGTFLLDNFIQLLFLLNIDFQPAGPDIILPVGISFYTFQSLSYTLDIYRGKLKPWDSFSDFALYVTFFPQLVAGPIVRACDFLPQLVKVRRASVEMMGWGLTLLSLGLFQKVVLADGIFAPVVDTVFDSVRNVCALDGWVALLAFSCQIFFDFSGYSTCAIGTGLCLGFTLPDNFRFPYGAIGFSDFWKRWHISLSSWLRDYLYIPLGGNKKGRVRTLISLLVTMLLGGLWHGASWSFVFWGALHAVYLIAERGLRYIFSGKTGVRKNTPAGAVGFLLALITFLLLNLSWIFFRAPDLHSAFILFNTVMLGGATGLRSLLSPAEVWMVFLLTGALLSSHWLMRNSSLEAVAARVSWEMRAVIISCLLITLLLVPGDDRAFIYFQF